VIKAAGAILWRRADDGSVEVAVIHRPKYDDWSLPKGKLDGGETEEEAAVREVEEETGFTGHLGPRLGTTEYESSKGSKIVHYRAMDAGPGRVTPHDEVDDLRWVTVGEAMDLLSYDRDRQVLARFSDE